jgi:hypothetical protein
VYNNSEEEMIRIQLPANVHMFFISKTIYELYFIYKLLYSFSQRDKSQKFDALQNIPTEVFEDKGPWDEDIFNNNIFEKCYSPTWLQNKMLDLNNFIIWNQCNCRLDFLAQNIIGLQQEAAIGDALVGWKNQHAVFENPTSYGYAFNFMPAGVGYYKEFDLQDLRILEIIKTAISVEELAHKQNEWVLYRGCELDKNGREFLFDKQGHPSALSFGHSLFGGLFLENRPGGAMACRYLYESGGYAILIKKCDYLRKKGDPLFFIPPIGIMLGFYLDGEHFHPRLKVNMKYTQNYNAIGGFLSPEPLLPVAHIFTDSNVEVEFNLLFNNSTIFAPPPWKRPSLLGATNIQTKPEESTQSISSPVIIISGLAGIGILAAGCVGITKAIKYFYKKSKPNLPESTECEMPEEKSTQSTSNIN